MSTYLTCFACGGEYSDSPGDYFTLAPREVIRCAVCAAPLSLVVRTVTITTLAHVVTVEKLRQSAQAWDAN